MMQLEERAFDYDRLLARVAAYIFEDEDLPINYFLALSTRSDLANDLKLSQVEWSFLQWNVDFIKRVVHDILPASMLYLTHKQAFGSFWTRELSRMTGVSEQKVNRWANRLATKSLVMKRPVRTSYGLRVLFVATDQMPNINKLLVDLVLTRRYTFARVSGQIGLRAPVRGHHYGHGPRLHDLRHRFAACTLVDWYRAGVNVEQRLPYLATYLGHVHVNDTYWYLEAVPELLALATERLVNGGKELAP